MTEAQIQRALKKHLDARLKRNVVAFPVPNGGKRDAISGYQLKLQGVVRGVADYIFLRDGTAYALELKKIGGRASPAQTDWLGQWERAGGQWAIAYGLDAALAILTEWKII